ncbi:MAG: 50S ribosomal protein L10 [Elusimicrobiota bacterium]|nr:50S ribosomal protein L10 [Elusimicrobiota bacterium]
MYKTAQKHKLSRQQKEKIIEWLKHQFKNSKCVIFTTFSKLTAKESDRLRKDLSGLKSSYRVVKNQLLNRALSEVDLSGLKQYIRENIGIVFCDDDNNILPSVRYVVNYSKENPQLRIVAGYIYETIVDTKKVEEISKLPSREEIMAKVVGLLRTPIQRFYSVLRQPMVSLVNIIYMKSKSVQ